MLIFLVRIAYATMFWTFVLFLLKTILRLGRLLSVFIGKFFVQLNIAYNGLSNSSELQTHICATNLLDKLAIMDLYQFSASMMESDVSLGEFQRVINNYSHIAVARRKLDGSLRGMILVKVENGELDGKKYNLMTMGLCLVHQQYRNGPFIPGASLFFYLRELILHPFTPLLVIGKSFSLHSYLVLVKNFKEHYPRMDKETPAWEKKIMSNFGKQWETDQERFNEATGVIERERTKLRSHIVPISTKDLTNPHTAFYCTQNPGWRKGHCMVQMGKFTWIDVLLLGKKIIYRSLGIKSNCSKLKCKQLAPPRTLDP
ncbi:uncharacterized protein [Dysidea avara]|uniref:uncharacterized protein n=1 Tax=Dysidea avara TaxID=196820 RepID=UPI00332C8E8A